jgi:very-short-patch-repair endonuclease
MGITMNEITDEIKAKIQDDVIRDISDHLDIKPDAVINARRARQIQDFALKLYELRKRNYYTMGTLEPMKRIINKQIWDWAGQGSDSKAEAIFYDKLAEAEIPFVPQYRIGRYRVDFLLNKWLIVELDGPHHRTADAALRDKRRDEELKRLGYEVVRLPLDMVSINPQLVVEELKRKVDREQ